MAYLSALRLCIAATLIVVTTAFLRILYILPSKRISHQKPRAKSRRNGASHMGKHMVIVLGSGGHTAEMMSLMRDFDPRKYKHRTYIMSSGDGFSSSKAFDIETRIQTNHADPPSKVTNAGEYSPVTGTWDVKLVPRARKIHQPLYTTPFSALWCLLGCFKALNETARYSRVTEGQFPDVIVTNGPATAVIFILAATILKFFAVAPVWSMKIIYVESWARVKTLSLSGKILLKTGLCERFFVQWEKLALAINGPSGRKKVEWEGFLVE
ncbi:hypothetical protein HYALB_00001105 [Hymenoscyphus albidus]|uniref:UDP-N-acetylglucosamine transferase subunit ALG14 n=1 Tax=Hymenoscyphus albidus TaxID=595503 RepID=A0A9N9LGR9_9HELO|nr:hypothetical protein HYALB_00001105 [Hymenoscyphus albidus]